MGEKEDDGKDFQDKVESEAEDEEGSEKEDMGKEEEMRGRGEGG